jgi:peptidoglycan-associated lipoprotein
MTRNPSTLLLSSLLVLLTACSSTPMATDTGAAATAAQDAAAAAAQAKPAATMPAQAKAMPAASTVATVTLPAYLDPKSSLSTERSVYFDYDEYAVKRDYAGLVERHGRFLASHPEVAIRIEGNSDERGGTEYNLALGQKRAEAVLRALKIYGVREQQLEAVSWGESKPMSTDATESAWSQDRRADLQYPRK